MSNGLAAADLTQARPRSAEASAAVGDRRRAGLDRLWARGRAFLGADLAIMGGAMTWVSERNLVAAISNAGGFGVIASAILVSFLVSRYFAFFSAAIVYNSAAVSERPTVINMARVLVYSTYGLFFTQGVLWIFAFLGTGVAIRGSRTFGRGYSWMNIAFGLLFILFFTIAAKGFAAPDAPNVALLFIGLFYAEWTIFMGQKLYRLSRPWS